MNIINKAVVGLALLAGTGLGVARGYAAFSFTGDFIAPLWNLSARNGGNFSFLPFGSSPPTELLLTAGGTGTSYVGMYAVQASSPVPVNVTLYYSFYSGTGNSDSYAELAIGGGVPLEFSNEPAGVTYSGSFTGVLPQGESVGLALYSYGNAGAEFSIRTVPEPSTLWAAAGALAMVGMAGTVRRFR